MDELEKKNNSPEMKVAYASIEEMTFKAGRRSWISYRDLGVRDASNGVMSAEIMHIDDTKSSKPTGWHYHTSDIQFLYVVQGWVKMEFPVTGVLTLKEGESIMIPKGVVHQELCSSEPLRLLEIALPGGVNTVPVETPDWSQESAAHYGVVEPVLKSD